MVRFFCCTTCIQYYNMTVSKCVVYIPVCVTWKVNKYYYYYYVDLATGQCRDWFMHNCKECKWNICTSLEYTYKLLFLCFRRTVNCNNVFRYDFSQRDEIFGIPEEIKYCSWINTIVCYQLSTKRHDLHIKGLPEWGLFWNIPVNTKIFTCE